MHSSKCLRGLLAVAIAQMVACDVTEPADDPSGLSPMTANFAQAGEPAPGPLTTLTGGGSSLEVWPFTAASLGGPAADPMNVVFPDADVRSVRAALMMLD